MRSLVQNVACLLLTSLVLVGVARAGTATGVTGLYYTGVNNSGNTLPGGSQDGHWTVSYASVPGTSDANYQGAAYVVSNNELGGNWVPNSSTARWITAPGAATSETGSNVNGGGAFLPGNGTTGTNAGQYIYRLAFTINGTGTGAVTNQVSISLTVASDDQYAIYLNPTLNANGSINTAASTQVGSGSSAWDNTSAEYMQNYEGGGHADNADFVIGTNYIYVVVDNTNSIAGSSTSNALNPSGLLVYQVGSAINISPKPVPEVGAILPVVGALGLLLFRRFRPGAASPV